MDKTEGRSLDLDNPKDARFFLRGVRFDGKAVTELSLADGKVVKVDDLSDQQAIRYAKDIYFDFLGGKEGQGGVVTLEPEGDLQ